MKDCVSIGRAFGGGVASCLSRSDEPITFRRCHLFASLTEHKVRFALHLVLRSLRPPPAPPSGCCKLDSPHFSGWPRLQCCSCSTPAEESKQVHRHLFHLSQNKRCVKGQDKRQAALDASLVLPTTTQPSSVAKLASLDSLLFPVLGGPLCGAEI